ncbi:hypothetical protein VC83_04942 [Pseudogymnoascus destructans]|uniref:Uncharacterized protein n=1 Tax=Pseudogymnoascus destructans TaxID=655981 RepID=A0A177A8Y7_9PEZI|nr:uncharacterized protein VC83_04942 [Pseudogymnoascus destructans]OAF58608.1 hypothetical protein VC83_04942 [Pseudogymnoascus destructans]
MKPQVRTLPSDHPQIRDPQPRLHHKPQSHAHPSLPDSILASRAEQGQSAMACAMEGRNERCSERGWGRSDMGWGKGEVKKERGRRASMGTKDGARERAM